MHIEKQKLLQQPLRKGSSRKSSKSKQYKNPKKKVTNEIKGKDETKTDTTDEPQFLSEKKQAKEISFKSSKANQAQPQFISGRKMDDGHKVKEELFKSCKMGKGAFKTGKTNKVLSFASFLFWVTIPSVNGFIYVINLSPFVCVFL